MKLGYTLFYVDDVEKTMIFYKDAFSLEIGFLHPSKDYGEMVTGDTKLGFVDHKTAKSHGFKYNPVDSDQNPPGVEIGFISENVQKSYQQAIKNGAYSLSKPTRKSWGQDVAYIKDINGFIIEICSPIK